MFNRPYEWHLLDSLGLNPCNEVILVNYELFSSSTQKALHTLALTPTLIIPLSLLLLAQPRVQNLRCLQRSVQQHASTRHGLKVSAGPITRKHF